MLFEVFKVGVDLFSKLNEARWEPFGLEGELLLFFRDLKKSIDTKDIQRLKKLIADDYYSSSFVNTDKNQLLSYFDLIFNTIPLLTHPSLEVEICTMPEIKDRQVFLVFKPTLNVQALGITLISKPFGSQDRIAVILRRDNKSNLLSILNMEDID